MNGIQQSGRPGSNRPPSAWKADALPTELLPLLVFYIDFAFRNSTNSYNQKTIFKTRLSGERRIRTFEAFATDLQSVPFGHSGISPSRYQLFITNLSRWRDSNPRPTDYKSVALANWATSAFLFEFQRTHYPQKRDCKCRKAISNWQLFKKINFSAENIKKGS